jgi:hypothetical protein
MIPSFQKVNRIKKLIYSTRKEIKEEIKGYRVVTIQFTFFSTVLEARHRKKISQSAPCTKLGDD